MPHKGRLSPDEKVKIVEGYMSGVLGKSAIINQYGVGWTTVRDWVRKYKVRGAEGLIPSTHFKRYTPETKRMAVEEYMSGKASQSDICAKYDISERFVLRQWIKVYNDHEDFKQPNSGGGIYMAKGRNTTLEERIDIVSQCISNDRDYGKIVELYGVSYGQVYSWVRKYERDGPNGLVDRRGKRKGDASMTEVEKLQAQLKLQKAENMRLQMENDLLKKLEEIERRRGRS